MKETTFLEVLEAPISITPKVLLIVAYGVALNTAVCFICFKLCKYVAQ